MKKTHERVSLLRVLNGEQAGHDFSVSDGVTVGSNRSSDVCLRDAAVSWNHARLRTDGDEVIVEDCGSANGTLVNGRPVQRATVKPGDVLSVGSTRLLLVSAEGAESPAGSAAPQPELATASGGAAGTTGGDPFADEDALVGSLPPRLGRRWLELQDEVEARRSEADQLRAAHERQRRELEKLRQEGRQRAKELSSLNKENERLRGELEAEERQRSQVADRATVECAALSREVEDLKAKLAAAHAEAAQKDRDLDHARECLRAAESRTEELRASILSAERGQAMREGELQGLLGRVSYGEKEIERLRVELKGERGQLAALREDYEKRWARMVATTEDLAERHTAQLEETRASWKERLERAEELSRETHAQAELVRTEMAAEKARALDLQRQCDALRARLEDESHALREAEHRRDLVASEIKKRDEEASELRRQCDALRDEFEKEESRLRSELERQEELFREATTEREALRLRLEEESRLRDDLERERETVRDGLAEREQQALEDVEAARAEATALQARYEEQERLFAALEEACDGGRERSRALEARAAELQTELARAEAVQKDLQARLDELESSNASTEATLRAEIGKHERVAAQVARERDDEQVRREDLEEEKVRLQGELGMVRSYVEELQEKLDGKERQLLDLRLRVRDAEPVDAERVGE